MKSGKARHPRGAGRRYEHRSATTKIQASDTTFQSTRLFSMIARMGLMLSSHAVPQPSIAENGAHL